VVVPGFPAVRSRALIQEPARTRTSWASFEIQQVNIVMALVTIGVLLSVHSPILDLKRLAVMTEMGRRRPLF
jgi:hypothetical protein